MNPNKHIINGINFINIVKNSESVKFKNFGNNIIFNVKKVFPIPIIKSLKRYPIKILP